MTEVPDAILWIATVGLVILTILVSALVISVLVLVKRVKQLINQVGDIAEPLKGAAQSAGQTVTTFSNSLLRPLATAAGVMAGFRKGVNSVTRKGRKR